MNRLLLSLFLSVLAQACLAAGLDPSFGKGLLLPSPQGLRDHESFAMVRSTGGALYLAGYAGTMKSVQACYWALSPEGAPLEGFGERGAWALPSATGGKEDRVYAEAQDRQGRLLGTGFSKGPDRKMRLAVWRILP